MHNEVDAGVPATRVWEAMCDEQTEWILSAHFISCAVDKSGSAAAVEAESAIGQRPAYCVGR